MDDGALPPVSDDLLVAELSRLGLRHLSGVDEAMLHLQRLHPRHLLCGLVMSEDARVQMALVPLFLHCPSYGVHVPDAVDWLSKAGLPKSAFDAPAADTLQLYYQAAVYIQTSLQQGPPLTDLYSAALGLTPATQIMTPQDAEAAVQAVADIHAQRAGSKVINWARTYRHQLDVYAWYASPKP